MRSVVQPNTPVQRTYVEMLRAPRPYVVVASGPAGCGKTLLAAAVGCEQIEKGLVKRIVVVRPAVSVDEQHGFLPGGVDEKMEPWARPVLDAIERSFSAAQVKRMRRDGTIEVVPLAYMRGRTFDDAWVICDEAQNCTPQQVLMMLTRIGGESKIVLTGDLAQHDRGYEDNGLADLLERIASRRVDPRMVGAVRFDDIDAMRHPVIPVILDMYSSL